ncbi:MAG: helix-turn-helix domain-containing protein [Christensenellales bacterium]
MNKSTNLFRNNFTVVFDWMITDLDLKGNELLVYSVIYGFSQDGAGEFNGSIDYLRRWTNSTKKTVISALNSLQEKGLITKSTTQVGKYKVCKYKAVPFSGVEITPDTGVKITPSGVEITPDTGVKITPSGVKNTPNNIGHNIAINNIGHSNTHLAPIIAQYSDGDPEIEALIREWMKFRKMVKKPVTETSLELNLRKLARLASESHMTKKEYLQAVIEKGWLGFYAIRDKDKGGETSEFTASTGFRNPDWDDAYPI